MEGGLLCPPREGSAARDPGTQLPGHCGRGSRQTKRWSCRQVLQLSVPFCREAQTNGSSRFDPIRNSSIRKRERDWGTLTQSGSVPFHVSVPHKHAASRPDAPCHLPAPGEPQHLREPQPRWEPSARSIPPSATRPPACPLSLSPGAKRSPAGAAGAPRAGRCRWARGPAGGSRRRERPQPRRPLTWAGLGVVVAAVEGAGARLVAVAGPVGAVGPPAEAEAGRVAARAAEPAGGAAGVGAAGQGRQGQQRQQGGPAGTPRHGGAAPSPTSAPRGPARSSAERRRERALRRGGGKAPARLPRALAPPLNGG